MGKTKDTRRTSFLLSILEGENWPSFLGSKEFAVWVKGKFYANKRNDEIPHKYLTGNWLRKRD
ncbi:MAG: hypothetical protein U9N77_08465 [Thermodesulfobacteriota bacterium]|nr:hypothetical protein [Thermodesulfobacteriota bacterium]